LSGTATKPGGTVTHTHQGQEIVVDIPTPFFRVNAYLELASAATAGIAPSHP